jgi:septum formation protein
MNQPRSIVLASQSPRRRQLIEGLGLSFEIIPSGIEEIRHPGEAPAAFAKRAALEKGEDVKTRLEEKRRTPWIISADTIVVLGDDVFFKPTDAEDAISMLRRLQGRTHKVITGWAVGRSGVPFRVAHTETLVTFHPLSEGEIARYVATGEGMDKAGAYAIQGIGAYLVARIDGDYFNVVGLPVSFVARALTEVGALPHYPLP